jgi:hypothetical protein
MKQARDGRDLEMIVLNNFLFELIGPTLSTYLKGSLTSYANIKDQIVASKF